MKKKKRKEEVLDMKGCLIALGIAFGLFLIIIGFISYRGYSMYKEAVSWTEEKAVELNIPQITDEDKKNARITLDRIKGALTKGDGGVFKFNEHELNALIASDENFSGKAVVRIEGDVLKADVSMPLNVIPGFSGRYLNGEIVLVVGMENGRPVVRISELSVRGKVPPDDFMEGLKKTNALDGSYKDPEKAKFLKNIKNICVKDGKVEIELRGDESKVTKVK